MSAPKYNEQFESQHRPEKENETEAGIVWSKFLEIIKSNVSELKFNTWFKSIKAKSFRDNSLLISVPSQDFYDMVISRFGDKILTASKAILGKDGKLLYEIAGEPVSKEGDTPAEKNESITDTAVPEKALHYRGSSVSSKPVYNLDPNYTFENFVKGKNNEFATAAAMSISNSPAAQYNPLLIYGGVGLGKTHLMQAIGNYLLSTHRAVNIMYISGPEFTTSFIQSIRSNKIHEFEKFYKSLDILIVDDIQFFEGKESTQDSFFQIFNSLYQLKRQIVLSCDKPPHQLEGLEERLVTRFQWGLTVDIQPPDLETRIAILNKKCDIENVRVPAEVLEFIALNIKDNIRSLEGCLKNMIFDAELSRTAIDMDIARRSVLKFGTLKNRKQIIDISSIISIVSKHFDIDESLLRMKTKRQEIVLARHSAMFLARELTNFSLQTIGAHFGGRNHASVIHACKCMEDMISKYPEFASKIQELREDLLTT
jgi:chromosomal replication initiator protein